MPWVKTSSEAHKAMKQYLVDIEGLTLGELVEATFSYAMENIEDFEGFLELEGSEESKKVEKENEEDSEEDS
jgi:hypothetical protein